MCNILFYFKNKIEMKLLDKYINKTYKQDG